MSLKDQPAFPVVGMMQKGPQEFMGVFKEGMTLRQWYAGIMAAGIASSDFRGLVVSGTSEQDVAQSAVRLADALITELEKANLEKAK